MAFLNVAKKIDIILIYGKTGRNSAKASCLHAERYSKRNPPSRRSFDRTVQLFRSAGNVNPPKRKRLRPVTGEATEVAVLTAIRNDPQLKIERYYGISKPSAQQIL